MDVNSFQSPAPEFAVDFPSMEFIEIERGGDLPAPELIAADGDVTTLAAERFLRESPARHLMLLDGARLLARASVWTDGAPANRGEPTAVLGHYAACDTAAGRRLLDELCGRLRTDGHRFAVGPMDGSTWRSYRLVVDSGGEAPFFLEPEHPPDWPEHFAAAAFVPIATYRSAVAEDLTRTDARLADVGARLACIGVAVRCIDMDRFEPELAALHDLCLTAFAGNFLYTPIAPDAFMELYLPLREHVRPELVLVAEHEGMPVGFVFAIPDLAQARRGEAVTQVIVKTVAIVPERRYAGLGGLLVQRAHDAAHALGYRRAIHALMHDSNRSRGISARYASVFRRYALFARELES